MKKYIYVLAFIIIVGVTIAFSTDVRSDTVSDIPVRGYKLVWSDEFNSNALDLKKWSYRALGPRRGGINVKNSVSFDEKGYLILTTTQNNHQFHTAMIGSQGKFETTFGYFECRVRLQEQIGHWSAFWLQSPTIGRDVGNTADSGTEIDIFEYLRREGDTVHHTLHWDGYREDHKSIGETLTIPRLSKGWHTFGLLWTEKEYIFYVDGQETWRATQALSKRSEYIILSLEVGKWAGNISNARLPDSLYIDYVRVYQKRHWFNPFF